MAKKKGQKSAVTLGKRRLRERVNGCVIRVNELIQGIPFEKLTAAVFLFCQDMKTEQFVHKYEAQIELAGANPERFANELYDFFIQMAKEIKENNLYQEFFEFLGLSTKIHSKETDPQSEKERTLRAYMTLLLQQLEFLRPSQYDLSTIVCGITTTGEIMMTPDFCPDFELLKWRIKEFERKQRKKDHDPERKQRKKDRNTSDDNEEYLRFIAKAFAKWGFKVHSLEGVDHIALMDDIFSTHHAVMAQFINEYTYDMLPDVKNTYTTLALPFYGIYMCNWTAESLIEQLKKRAKTLPTNGVTLIFEYADQRERHLIEKLRMKEILYGDRVIMLYRMWTQEGELSGYYDTREGYLYSAFFSASDRDLYEQVKTFILYFYAALVTRNGAELIELANRSDEAILMTANKEITPYTVKVFGNNGKLIDTYAKTGPVKLGSHKLRVGDPAYISEVRAIQGFVRKVGAGKKPSPEAVARAQALGYDLAPDETYVQGFFRSVLKLKDRTS